MLDEIIPYCPRCRKSQNGNDHSDCFSKEELDQFARNRKMILEELESLEVKCTPKEQQQIDQLHTFVRNSGGSVY